ncbi:MAG: RNase adapter RapZ [Microvirgula sp.]
MQLILISGLSGSGKSIALRMLEDSGFYCIDNLPASLLTSVVEQVRPFGYDHVAISVDTRSAAALGALPAALDTLRASGDDVRVLFLDAQTDTLIRRFSETRRRHPLSGCALTIPESVAQERQMLGDVAELGHRIDTSDLSANQLRRYVRTFVSLDIGSLVLIIQSFGFKHGVPLDADFVFDTRCLPNPYYDPELRPMTGRDAPVAAFLAAEPQVGQMEDDIAGLIERWLPAFRLDNRNYLTVAIGCTGGQHRSVYLGERLATRLRQGGQTVLVRHRELDEA